MNLVRNKCQSILKFFTNSKARVPLTEGRGRELYYKLISLRVDNVQLFFMNQGVPLECGIVPRRKFNQITLHRHWVHWGPGEAILRDSEFGNLIILQWNLYAEAHFNYGIEVIYSSVQSLASLFAVLVFRGYQNPVTPSSCVSDCPGLSVISLQPPPLLSQGIVLVWLCDQGTC